MLLFIFSDEKITKKELDCRCHNNFTLERMKRKLLRSVVEINIVHICATGAVHCIEAAMSV